MLGRRMCFLYSSVHGKEKGALALDGLLIHLLFVVFCVPR